MIDFAEGKVKKGGVNSPPLSARPNIVPVGQKAKAAKTLYLVSQFKAETKEGIAWEFQGIFDTEEAAKASCRDSTYCYFPVKLNETVAHETVIPTGAVYPITDST